MQHVLLKSSDVIHSTVYMEEIFFKDEHQMKILKGRWNISYVKADRFPFIHSLCLYYYTVF